MPRTVTSFEIGNVANLKLTDELAELFINTLKATGRISISAGRCCVGARTVRTWLQKGREADAEEPFKSFADRVERARAEFLAVAAQRMGQLAVGGLLNLPRYDKLNQLVRDANGEIEFEERYFPPNINALAHVLDRIDPEPNLQPPGPEAPERPELSQEERQQRALADYRLVREALEILETCGQPLAVSLNDDSIPTTAKVVDFLPELPPPVAANVPEGNVSDVSEPAAANEPTEPTAPEPGRRKFEESF